MITKFKIFENQRDFVLVPDLPDQTLIINFNEESIKLYGDKDIDGLPGDELNNVYLLPSTTFYPEKRTCIYLTDTEIKYLSTKKLIKTGVWNFENTCNDEDLLKIREILSPEFRKLLSSASKYNL